MTDNTTSSAEANARPRVITYEEALAGLRRAIALKGEDYVYEKIPTGERPIYAGCRYFTKDTAQPSCIVGHLFADMGITPATPGFEEVSIGDHSRNFIRLADRRTEILLSTAQSMQDDGYPWGRALEAALEAVEDRA